MTAATKADLQALHAQLAKVLADRLVSGAVTAAELNVVRQFLKDSDVVAQALPGTPMGQLAEAAAANGMVLPFRNGPRIGSFGLDGTAE